MMHFFLLLKIQRCMLLHEKCPYSEFFWSIFSRIWTVYHYLACISPYSLEMREYTDLKISKCRQFSRNVYYAILPSSLASFTDRICIIIFK